jgi:electron transfer flavoprotein beta subunit
MKILVPIKRVPDPYIKVKLNADGTDIETTGIKYEINPFDEIAVEEAVRLSEKQNCEIVAVSIGRADCAEQLTKALAMGAHRAVLVETDQKMDSLGIAKTLLAVVRRESPDLVLMGKQAIDDDSNQAGQMLAALWNRPQATFASKVEVTGSGVQVTRETDAGQETLELPLPCVITTDLRLNEPRYVALPGIIKARSKPTEKLSLADLAIDAECRVEVTRMSAPPPRAAGRKVVSVDELISELKSAGAL